MASIKVCYSDPLLQQRAKQLAEQLGLPLSDEMVSAVRGQRMDKKSTQSSAECDYLLNMDFSGLSLITSKQSRHGPIQCDFVTGSNGHRRKFGGGNGQAIARAVGVSGKFLPEVVDLTAGMGGDSFVLACLGCSVRLVERHPVVHRLLRDGLQRAASSTDEALTEIITRMALLEGDAKDYLHSLSEPDYPDIIYLDPMFPERKKSAKVKKEMQAFHHIVGADEDASELIQLALNSVRYRVVVKRPTGAPYLGGTKPDYSLKGKSTRFDVFALHKLPA